MSLHAVLSRTSRRSSHIAVPHRAFPSCSFASPSSRTANTTSGRSNNSSNSSSSSSSSSSVRFVATVASSSSSSSVSRRNPTLPLPATINHSCPRLSSSKSVVVVEGVQAATATEGFCRRFTSSGFLYPTNSPQCPSITSTARTPPHNNNIITTTPHFHSSSLTTSQILSGRVSLTPITLLKTPGSFRRYLKHPSRHLHQVRSCSFHRAAMCKHFSPETEGSTDVTKSRVILPADVKPTHYDLTLEPSFEDFTFKGEVKISVDCVKETKEISLNQFELNIEGASLESSGSTQQSKNFTHDEDKQWITAHFDEPLKAGSKGVLTMKFTGKLNDNMCGFYRSSYKSADTGEVKWLVTTQMEPTDARRAFPCFDEPALKATFAIALVADKKLTCLSNMDVRDEKDASNGKKTVQFNTTPLMSTYLICFIVGELQYIETKAFRIPVRVYAPYDVQNGQFSLDLAAKTLKFYEETFASPFPLPKMDMVAIPDFSAGAMENWGLVTYRVVDLLYDEKKSGAATKQRVAEVVQHELAHQWFGNLVTMDFWDGLWLNEGFATWMSWYSCNVFYPEWKVWQGYVTDNLQSALGLDSLRSSHPIEVPVTRADEINQIFDAISYSKGSCVLRMISTYIGEDVFMKGIQKYLKKHAYGNTKTDDLWAALSEASGKDISEMMAVWTKKVGYPVLTVTEQSDGVHVKQNRFLRTADVKAEEDETIFPVGLRLKTKEGVQDQLLLTERETTIPIKDMDFFKLNADHCGIYRVSYSPERLTKLGQAAKSGLLSVEDRSGMIADAGALAASNFQKTSGLLGLLAGFKEEKDYIVWEEILTRLGSVRAAWIFEPQEVKDALKAFNKNLVVDMVHSLGWEFKETDDHILQQFKSLMFGNAGLCGDEKVVAAAKEMFEKFANGDKTAIHPNLRSSVYAIALQEGGEREYNIVVDAYRNGTSSDERNVALRNLGRSKHPECIKRTLDFALSSEVKEQDIYLPFSGLRAHVNGIDELWAWAKENWGTLEKKLPPGLSMLGTIVQIVTGSFTSHKAITDIETFFGSRSTKGFDQGLAQSLDTVRAKSSWVQRDQQDVKEWLIKNNYLKQ